MFLALLLIGSAPDVVEGCAAAALNYRTRPAGTIAAACSPGVVNGQMIAACEQVLAGGLRVSAARARFGGGADAARLAVQVDADLAACRRGGGR